MDTTIRTKIVWTFAILVTLSLVGSFWSIYNFYAMGTTVATILRENYQSVLAAENMVKLLERQDNALLAQSEGEEATMAGGFEDNKKLFYYWEDQAAQWGMLPASQAVLDSIRNAYGDYIIRSDSMISRNQQGAFREARQYYYDVVRYHSDRLRELCFLLFQVNQNAMVNAEARTHSIASQTAYGTMIVSLIVLALSIIATAWLIKVVIKPAEELTETEGVVLSPIDNTAASHAAASAA